MEETTAAPIERFKYKVNQKIKLTLNGGGEEKVYKSVIQEVLNDVIGVSAPMENGAYVFFNESQPLQAQVCVSTGIYTFSSMVVGKYMGALPILYLSKPQQVRRSQYREDIRTNTYLEVYYKFSREKGISPLFARNESGQGWTRDISSGGVCLGMAQEPPAKSVINLHIAVPRPDGLQRELVRTKAEVLRVTKDKYQDKYLTGMRFLEISEGDRRLINNYVLLNERM